MPLLAPLPATPLEPVSYTHLDVYKRQLIENWKNDIESLTIITPINENIKREIECNLNYNEINNYIKFWD